MRAAGWGSLDGDGDGNFGRRDWAQGIMVWARGLHNEGRRRLFRREANILVVFRLGLLNDVASGC